MIRDPEVLHDSHNPRFLRHRDGAMNWFANVLAGFKHGHRLHHSHLWPLGNWEDLPCEVRRKRFQV